LPIAGLLILALLVSRDARDASSALMGDDLRNDVLAEVAALDERKPGAWSLVLHRLGRR